VVDLKQLKVALDDAIDTIGAYSHLNPAWLAEKEKLGVQPPPPPRWVKQKEKAAKA
jgi:hypothetical protein